MTFLELVQEVVRYSNTADSGPSTTVNQSGDFLKAIKYVQTAHAEIQGMFFDWDFLWGQSTITVIKGISSYSGVTGIGIWDVDRVFIDGNKLDFVDYADYSATRRNPARPNEFTITPDNRILLIPEPDDDYSATYDYYRRPKILNGNDDEPLIPAQFRMAIVGRALMQYGNFDSAEDVKVQGSEMYQMFIEQLMRHQLSRRQQTHGRQDSRRIEVITE
jgi:hypothetical protein